MSQASHLASLLLLSLLAIGLSETTGPSSHCGPNYPRMFFNPAAESVEELRVDLVFMFNTNVSCPMSWVTVYQGQSIYKFGCQQ